MTYTGSLTLPMPPSSLVAGRTDRRSQIRHVPSCDPDTSEYSFSGLAARLTTLLACPRSVMTLVAAVLVRGSTRVMCRAEVPQASKGAEAEERGSAASESSACEVVKVLTTDEVVRSRVLTVWSCDTE